MKILSCFLISILYFSPLICSDVLDHAIIGVYAVDANTGDVLLDQNSDLSLIPASCMKIVTTAAALQVLGAHYRFETVLEYDGVIDDTKTLIGNLYIRGSGDPCLGSGRIPGSLSWRQQIDLWANAIQTLGLKTIKGKIVGDASSWEQALAVPSWSWEDLGNYYGAGACALSFHENSYQLVLQAGLKMGEATQILRTDPPIANLILQNEVKTGPDGSGDNACIYGSELSMTQTVRGTIPLGQTEFSIKGAIPDPATLCATLLSEALQKRGIILLNQPISSRSTRIPFHKTLSPCVGEIVYWTNQKSINLYAEHLLKKMGEVMYNEGSTRAGIQAVQAFWRTSNIALDGFNMFDGSGLSRKNLITAKQLVSILLKMKSSSLFLDSLPKKNDIAAKTGTMALIKGYAGYKNNIAFAILINQCPDKQAMQEKIDLLLDDIKK